MRHKTLDEMISYFNQEVAKMDIKHEDKIKLLGMIMTIGFEAQKHKWIPVSERLPDTEDDVIVSVLDESGDTPFAYTTMGWRLLVVEGLIAVDKNIWIIDNEIHRDVIAWMPLPEPYKEGRS